MISEKEILLEINNLAVSTTEKEKVQNLIKRISFKVKRNETKTNKDVKFEDLSRERVQNYLSGAIFKVNIDNTHPLAYGYENEYYSLKTSSSTYEKLKRGFNVGKINDDEISTIGFVGNNIKENFKNSLVFGHERIGRGNVIYLSLIHI